ncbi:ArgE/DapE family deacylase [Neobacillus sp. SM06]|uniref:ArgE/DapE family deacylase n=1 Tax=Neobacillus sp. SM06 TaxID=3422492 RepID=UPI003D2D0E90
MNTKTLSLEKLQILQFIDDQQENLIDFLNQLVGIPSDNPPGDCQRIAEHLYRRLEEFKFENVFIHQVEEEKVKAVGMTKTANVIGFQSFGNDGLEITLNSHGDVVPPGKGWMQDPYGGQIVDGKMYGRGAAVSKSDIASFTFATLALREVKDHLSGKVSLAFTFDEESGGEIGPKWLLEKKLIHPDMAICPGFTYSLVNAHNGCLHLEVKLKGKSAHAAEPQFGHDALEAMNGVLSALYEYRKGFSKIKSAVPGIESPSLVVGLISGGINTNVVPDTAAIRLDRRLIPEEDPAAAESEIREIVTETLKNFPGVDPEVTQVLLAKSFGPISVDSPLIQAVKTNWRELMGGEELPVSGSPLYTDARHFYEAGIPVVLFGAGPRTLAEANGHRADENVRIEDLIKATKIVALTLYDLLQKK